MLKLEAGTVLHIWCTHCNPQKWKFYVVAFVEPKLRYFLINSQPAAFQRKEPELLAHQVGLLQKEHGFLSRNSVLDCSQLSGGPTASELEDMYQGDPKILLGRIQTSPRRAVRTVVAKSNLLTPAEIKAILGVW